LNRKVVVVAATVLLISLSLGCIEIEDVFNTTKGFFENITTEREPTPLDICRETVYAQMREDEKRMPVGIKHMEIVEIKKFNNPEEAISYIESYPGITVTSRSDFRRVVEKEEFFYVAIGRFDLEYPMSIWELGYIDRIFDAYVCDGNGTLIYG